MMFLVELEPKQKSKFGNRRDPEEPKQSFTCISLEDNLFTVFY